MAPYSSGARMPRTRGGRRVLGRCSTARWCAAPSAAGASSTAPASASAWRRWSTPTAASRRSWRWWPPSPSSSTRATTCSRALRVTGPLLWERPAEAVEPPPGDEPLVLVAPSTSQDPDQRMVARRAGRPGRRARARAGHAEPPPLPRAAGRAATTPAWSTGCPTPAPCRCATPWSATPATAPWPGRWPAACPWWAARRRATWPRTPPGWPGRAAASRCRAGSSRRAASGRRCASCWPTRATPSGRASWAPGPRATTGRRWRRMRWRSCADLKLRGWDSNPQPFD